MDGDTAAGSWIPSPPAAEATGPSTPPRHVPWRSAALWPPLALLLLISASVGRAQAQPTATGEAAPPAPPAEDAATIKAKQHNTMAKKLFSLGLFREAADEYRRAYKAKPEPAFLFNLAQCYKRMDKAEQLEEAIFYFESYLQNEPFSPFAPQIEKEIAQLERQISALRRPPPFYQRWWFWTAVGVVIAGAATGTALALQPEDQQPVLGRAAPGYFQLQ